VSTSQIHRLEEELKLVRRQLVRDRRCYSLTLLLGVLMSESGIAPHRNAPNNQFRTFVSTTRSFVLKRTRLFKSLSKPNATSTKCSLLSNSSQVVVKEEVVEVVGQSFSLCLFGSFSRNVASSTLNLSHNKK